MSKIKMSVAIVCITTSIIASTVSAAAPQSPVVPSAPAPQTSPLTAPPVLSPNDFQSQVKTLSAQNQAQLKQAATNAIANVPPLLPLPSDTKATKRNSADNTQTEPTTSAVTPESTLEVPVDTPPPSTNNTTPTDDQQTVIQNPTGFGSTSSSTPSNSSKSDSGFNIKY